MKTMTRLLMASAAMACLGSTAAFAAGNNHPAGQPDPYTYPGFSINVIGGGASFPSIVYRELQDCNFHPLGYGNVTGPGWYDINPNCPSAPFGTASRNYLWFYYVPTGSSNGKNAIKSNSNATLTTSITTTIPYTSSEMPTYPYNPAFGYHYSGSDDVWNLADQTAWNAAGGPASKFGNLIQIPAVAGAVAIVLNGKDGAGVNLTENGSAVTGSSSAINLSRQALCGIFAGKITKWNNPLLTALNGGVAMGSGQITVVHRFDGSGTTFLLTNALQDQCRAVTGPDESTPPVTVSYAFPWRDQSSCPALPRGANTVTWPDQYSTVCSSANPTPTGAAFTNSGSSGSQSLVDKVLSTPGAIGYVSPDFAQPVTANGPKAANLQNEFDVSTNSTGTPTFVAPTVAATAVAMSSVTPVFDSTTRGNPLAWSLQGVVPNPVLKAAYPIAGFSWLEMYQCYSTGNNIPVQLLEFVYTLYGTGNYKAIIESNGFAQVPGVWLNEVYALLSDDNLRPLNDATGACAGKAGAK